MQFKRNHRFIKLQTAILRACRDRVYTFANLYMYVSIYVGILIHVLHKRASKDILLHGLAKPNDTFVTTVPSSRDDRVNTAIESSSWMVGERE